MHDVVEKIDDAEEGDRRQEGEVLTDANREIVRHGRTRDPGLSAWTRRMSGVDVERTRHDVGLVQIRAGKFAHDAPVIHDRDAVAAADEFVVVGRIEQDRRALIGELAHEPVELLLGADVDAARRIVEQDDARFGHQPFGDHDLLLISARQGRNGVGLRADLDLKALDVRLRLRPPPCRASMNGPNDKAPSEAIVRLSATDIGSISPSVLRSSGTSAMPMSRALAWAGDPGRTARPLTVIAPVTPRSTPKSASSSVFWPWPSSPPRPTISPAPTSSEISSRRRSSQPR